MSNQHHRRTSSIESLCLQGLELLSLKPEEDIEIYGLNNNSPLATSIGSSDMSNSTNSDYDDYVYSDDEDTVKAMNEDTASHKRTKTAGSNFLTGAFTQLPKKRRVSKSLTKKDLEEAMANLIASFPLCGSNDTNKSDSFDIEKIQKNVNDKSFHRKVWDCNLCI
jgi:hypothetical protein